MKPEKNEKSEKAPRKDFRNNFRNNRRKHFHNFNREKNEENKVVLKCEICEKDIQDIASAIALPENGNPAHFDCVLKKLNETEKLENGEQIIYLGGGNFGIIVNSAAPPKANFKVVRRIEFEEKDKTPEWRKQLIKVKI